MGEGRVSIGEEANSIAVRITKVGMERKYDVDVVLTLPESPDDRLDKRCRGIAGLLRISQRDRQDPHAGLSPLPCVRTRGSPDTRRFVRARSRCASNP